MAEAARMAEASGSRKTQPETFAITVLDSTKVTFGPGFEVRQVVTGFESREIVIDHLPWDVTVNELSEELQMFLVLIPDFQKARVHQVNHSAY